LKSAVHKIPEKISGLLLTHTKDLEEAWSNIGDGEALNVSFSAKIGFDKQGKPACEVGIAFIKERVKDSVIFNWDDKQLSLLKPLRDLCPDGKELSSVTISSGRESVTLTPETREKLDKVINGQEKRE